MTDLTTIPVSATNLIPTLSHPRNEPLRCARCTLPATKICRVPPSREKGYATFPALCERWGELASARDGAELVVLWRLR